MSYRKLGRTADQRKAMLRSLVTALLANGKIVTTETRAKEVQSIAESIIASAVKEADNFESKQVTFSKAKVNSKGKYITISKKSKNGKDYTVRERETKTELRRVDNPSRLAARRRAISYVYNIKDKDGKNVKVVNKLFDEIAPDYKDRKGGYTRIVKIAQRRGDGALTVLLELV